MEPATRYKEDIANISGKMDTMHNMIQTIMSINDPQQSKGGP
jgi:hypothetical protein